MARERIPPEVLLRIRSMNLRVPEVRMALAGFLAAHLEKGGKRDPASISATIRMFAERFDEVAEQSAAIINQGSQEKH